MMIEDKFVEIVGIVAELEVGNWRWWKRCLVMEDGSLKEACTGGRADPLGVDGRNW